MSNQSKPKGPKTRFATRESIVEQIDKFTKKRDDKHRIAAQLIQDAKALRRMSASPECVNPVFFTGAANTKDHNAQKLGKQIKRLEEKVLPMWKRKLAEFQTNIIPGVLPDASVEAPE